MQFPVWNVFSSGIIGFSVEGERERERETDRQTDRQTKTQQIYSERPIDSERWKNNIKRGYEMEGEKVKNE